MRKHYVAQRLRRGRRASSPSSNCRAAPGGDEQVRARLHRHRGGQSLHQPHLRQRQRPDEQARPSSTPSPSARARSCAATTSPRASACSTARDAFRQVIIRTEPAGETAGGFKRRDVIIDVEESKTHRHRVQRRLLDRQRAARPASRFATTTSSASSGRGRSARAPAAASNSSASSTSTRASAATATSRFAPLTLSLQYQRDTSVTRFFRSTIDRGNFGIVQRFDEEGQPHRRVRRVDRGATINRFTFNAETQRDLELERTPSGAQRKRTTLFLRYNYEDVRLFNIDSLLIVERAPARPGRAPLALRRTLARDTRDRQFDPTRGDFLTVDYALALKQLGGNISFNKLNLTYRRYQNVSRLRNTVLAASVQLGLANILQPVRPQRERRDRRGRPRCPSASDSSRAARRRCAASASRRRGRASSRPSAPSARSPAPCRTRTRRPSSCRRAARSATRRASSSRSTRSPCPSAATRWRSSTSKRASASRETFRSCRSTTAATSSTASATSSGPAAARRARDPNTCQSGRTPSGSACASRLPSARSALTTGYLLNPPEFVLPQFGGAHDHHPPPPQQLHFRFGQTF